MPSQSSRFEHYFLGLWAAQQNRMNEFIREELLSEEKYFNDDNVPCFKRLYKRTYNSGKIELISTED